MTHFPHYLKATIGADGIEFRLLCPYETDPPTTLDTYPEWMIPVCRPARSTRCLAAEQIAAGNLAAMWGGPPTPLTSGMRIDLWTDDAGLRLTSDHQERPPDVEEAAMALARASRSPRYAGENWHLLLSSEANVDHAWREAGRRGVDQQTIDTWRELLHDRWWNAPKDARHAQSGTGAPPTR